MQINSSDRQLRSLMPLAYASWIAMALYASPATAAGVVGNGSSGSCDKTEFETRLAGGGTVTFNCGNAPHTITEISIRSIRNNTKIDGGGKITLQASNSNHFKVLNGKTLELENIALTGGNASTGGAIENLGTTIATGVTFADNTSSDKGGAILNRGTLIISRSTFRDNKAVHDGGAIWSDFGSAATVTIANSTFIDNLAESGGALFSNSRTTVEVSTFSGNEARAAGGAIFSINELTIKRSTLIGNQARGRGFNSGGGGIFYGGFATPLVLTESTLNGNIAAGFGGGLRASDAIYTNCTLSGNQSGNNGGGLYTAGRSVMRFTTVADNLSTSSRLAGIHIEGGTLSLQNTLLSNNRSQTDFNCSGEAREIVSLGHNLSSDTSCELSLTGPGDINNEDPELAPLANNGGMTWTHIPQSVSPAIDAGVMVDGITTDQREIRRPQGKQPDIGSVEVEQP